MGSEPGGRRVAVATGVASWSCWAFSVAGVLCWMVGVRASSLEFRWRAREVLALGDLKGFLLGVLRIGGILKGYVFDNRREVLQNVLKGKKSLGFE